MMNLEDIEYLNSKIYRRFKRKSSLMYSEKIFQLHRKTNQFLLLISPDQIEQKTLKGLKVFS